MRLLDRIVAFDEQGIVARTRVDPDAWYAGPDGSMPSWIGIELMAQAIAAHANLTDGIKDGAPRRGVLLGTRSFEATTTRFAPATEITVRARRVYREPEGLGAYDCELAVDERMLAHAVLKVFEPADFDDFVARSTP